MDKLLFLHREIKHVLEVLPFIMPDEATKLMASIANLNYEDLVKILKSLYKVERECFEYINQDTQNVDKFLASIKAIHD